MKILYVTARQPYPAVKGDQMVAYEQIKELSKYNEVYLVTFYTNDYDLLREEMSKYCTKLFLIEDSIHHQIFSIVRTLYNFTSMQANMFYRPGVKKQINKIYEEVKPDHVHVLTFRMASYFIRDKISKSIDFIDAYSFNMLKRARKTKGIIKYLWYLEYMLLSRFEKKILKAYKEKTIVAERDKLYLKDNTIIVNPLGTSIRYNDLHQCKGEEKNQINIIFQGNMSYYPNIEAVEYLAKDIFPILKEKYINLKLYIVGAYPCESIINLAKDDIIVTGYVKDMDEYLSKADIAIYPIFSATGMQEKVIEAMASHVPCIISRQCAEGIKGLINMENVMIADDKADYIKYFDFIINENEKDKVKEIVNNAFNLVDEKYSWQRNVLTLQNLWNSSAVNNIEDYSGYKKVSS